MSIVCDCGREVEIESVGMHLRKITCPDCGVIHDDRDQMGVRR